MAIDLKADLKLIGSYVKAKSSPAQMPKAHRLLLGVITKLHNHVNKLEKAMDKKMHQVTKSMKVAEKDVKKGAKKAAVKVLKKAEKKNEKLVKIDREVRDPIIASVVKAAKKVKKG